MYINFALPLWSENSDIMCINFPKTLTDTPFPTQITYIYRMRLWRRDCKTYDSLGIQCASFQIEKQHGLLRVCSYARTRSKRRPTQTCLPSMMVRLIRRSPHKEIKNDSLMTCSFLATFLAVNTLRDSLY